MDNSAVHPESYPLVKKIARHTGLTVSELIGNKDVIEKLDFVHFVRPETGLATLNDIRQELLKPGLDPRKKAKIFEFAKGINKITDLKIGMELPGIISNITNFGAFVNIGVKQDGLVHISHLADEFISNPADFVSLNQHVKVKVLDIDVPRKRISLSMKDVQ